MPSVDSPDASTLWRALTRIPPRSAQLLTFRCVEGRSSDDCAALYGISKEALGIHTLRAASQLRVALEDPTSSDPVLPSEVPAPPFEWERDQATRLEQSRCAELLSALQRQGPEIQRLSREAAQAELESPAARRADLLRRLALVGLIALAAWLYWKNRRPGG